MYLDNRYLNKAKQKAENILEQFKIDKPSVPVKDIVKKLNINLISYDLGEDVSGILVIENNIATIGYNPSNSKVRQRFTIAHELGHFLLHGQAKNEVFIDKDFIVKYRSEKKYTNTEIRQEQEANAFAANLLMPRFMLHAAITQKNHDSLDEPEFISAMAKIFDVSVPAMTFQIANSNLFF